jgi:hypothetical protein
VSLTDSPAREGRGVRALGASLGLALAGFAVGIVILVVLIRGLAFVGISAQESLPLQYGLTIVSLQGVGLMVTSLAYLRYQNRLDIIRVRLPTLRDAGYTLLGLVGLLAALAVVQVIVTELGLSTPSVALVEDGLSNPTLMLYLIPFMYLLVGPGEELMFRGAIQGMLGEGFPRWLAVVLASAVFAAVHVTNVIGSPPVQVLTYLAIIFVLSLILGAVYERTSNLIVPAFVHGTYNSLVVLSIYATATGVAPA